MRQPAPDSQLMEQVRAGDEAAFEQIYHRHERRVYGFLWGRVQDDALAADLTQETFARLWRARDSWQTSGSVAGYLLLTARTLLIDEHRRREVRNSWKQDVEAAPRASSPSPERVLERQETAERLNAAVDALPERTREVFTLKRDANLSYHEIAVLLGISRNTVGVHMYRALKQLRESLEDLR